MKLEKPQPTHPSFLLVTKEIEVPNPSADLAENLPLDNQQKNKVKSFRRSLWLWSTLGLFLGVGGFILSLPSMTSCGNAAKNSEGRHFIGAINRGQTAFWLENGKLAQKIPDLQLGITTETRRYAYKMRSTPTVAYHYGISKQEDAKNFIGAVFILPEDSPAFTVKSLQNTDQLSSRISEKNNWQDSLRQWNLIPTNKKLMPFSILCENQEKGSNPNISQPFLERGIPTCGKGTIKIS